MFNLNLPKNLESLVRILDPDNEHKIKDMNDAMKFINEIIKKNERKNCIQAVRLVL